MTTYSDLTRRAIIDALPARKEPNARLIAAAPDLLAAADEYLRLDCRYDDLTEECAAAKRALRAAIAKATGN